MLTHCDYWSGNVVWRNEALTGIVDWSGVARGPRGFDVGWCRLDLYLLFGEQLADVFLTAYQNAIGHPLADMALWDGWAIARSYDGVTSWAPNYRPLGRADLDVTKLRWRHSQWTNRVLERKLADRLDGKHNISHGRPRLLHSRTSRTLGRSESAPADFSSWPDSAAPAVLLSVAEVHLPDIGLVSASAEALIGSPLRGSACLLAIDPHRAASASELAGGRR